MKIFKFGGASVKDAQGVRNVAGIVGNADSPLVIVVSAMGKTTNAMEILLQAFMDGNCIGLEHHFQTIKEYHQNIVFDLMGEKSQYQSRFNKMFDTLHDRLMQPPSLNYDFEYDQIVSFGELISTSIVSAYLNHENIANQWIDVRNCIKTDDIYRDAGIDWELTTEFVEKTFLNPTHKIYLTQGFIGSTINNLTTTLGREGSDYTAAILGHILNAVDVTIWKDVPGVLSSDPRWYPNATLLPELSYWEAIELTYYGAQVIHPKTLKPLQNKVIPLRVRSFVNPQLPGTTIHHKADEQVLQPIIIRKTDQVYMSISPRDFSFILEDNLSDIFHVFGQMRIKVNLMQNTALRFSVCFDKTRLLDELLAALCDKYNISHNENLELVNIRHYNQNVIDEVIKGKEVVETQITHKTARYVVKASEWRF